MTKFQLNYFKPKKVDLEDLAKDSEEQNTFLIDGFQSYQPLYTEFFELSEALKNTID